MKKNTYFCDIDGTIFKYRNFDDILVTKPEIINSTFKVIKKWYEDGHHIVLITARPNEYRHHTVKELFESNVNYHQLIMGIERSQTYLINDMDPNNEGNRAIGINLFRDKGFDE